MQPAQPQPLYHQPERYAWLLSEAACDVALEQALVAAGPALETQGYAVVPNVIDNAAYIDACHDEFWRLMQASTRGRLTRPRSALDLQAFTFTGNWPAQRHGIFEDGAWAHTPLVHEVRTQPRVAHCFARLYGCRPEALVAAPDRINYQLPSEWLPRPPYKALEPPPSTLRIGAHGTWLHVDQALKTPGRRCIQGLVTLTDALQAGDASLECVPGSHLWHGPALGSPDLAKDKLRADWYKLSDDDKARLAARGATLVSVQAPRGSLVLWVRPPARRSPTFPTFPPG